MEDFKNKTEEALRLNGGKIQKPKRRLWSTWTFDWLPTYLTWTIMDIGLTTYLPHLVHVVCERPPIKYTPFLINFSFNWSFQHHSFLTTFFTCNWPFSSTISSLQLCTFFNNCCSLERSDWVSALDASNPFFVSLSPTFIFSTSLDLACKKGHLDII